MRDYDITIYGANGFTAKYVISQIRKYPLRVALSARSVSKIQYNPKNYPVIACDTNNLEAIMSKSVVLLNCAGPYIKCGEAVVESCIKNNCHYVDITGETTFIRKVIQKFGEMARERNVYILNCCGFDSVPCDMGFDIVKRRILEDMTEKGEPVEDARQESAEENLTGPVVNAESVSIYNYLKLRDAKCNYATFESFVHGLGSHFGTPKPREKRKSRLGPSKVIYSKERNCYCVIFLGTDHSVVTRSQSAFKEVKNVPIIDFYIYMEVGGLFVLMVFLFFMTIILWLAKLKIGRKMLLKFPGFFTCGRVKLGLEKEEIKKSSFEMNLYGYYEKNEDGKALQKVEKLTIKGPDPGYMTTSVCAVECAVLLLEKVRNEASHSLCSGGVVTSSMLFYDTDLVDRLKNEGIDFVSTN